jgi:hypothetical protein
LANTITRMINLGVDTSQAQQGFEEMSRMAVETAQKIVDSMNEQQTAAERMAQKEIQSRAQTVLAAKQAMDQQQADHDRLIKAYNDSDTRYTDASKVGATEREKVDAALSKSMMDNSAKVLERSTADLHKLKDEYQNAMTAMDQAATRSAQHQITMEQMLARERHANIQSAATRGAIGFARETAGAAGLPVPGFLGGPVGLMGAGVGLAAGAILRDSIQGVAEYADAINQLRIQSGATAKEISTMAAVAGKFNISTDELSFMLNNLKRAMVDQPQLFNAMGIALKNTDGSTRSNIEVFNELRKTLGGAKADANMMQVAQETLGRSAYQLLPYLSASDDQIKKLSASVQGTSQVIDEAGIKSAKEYSIKLEELARTSTNLQHTVGEAVVPVITKGLAILGQVFDGFGKFVTNVLEDLITHAAHFGNTLADLFKGDFEGAAKEANLFMTKGLGIWGSYTKAIKDAQAAADESEAARKERAAAMVDTGGGTAELESMRQLTKDHEAQVKAEQDVILVIREKISAIQQATAARVQEMRDTLEAFTRTRQEEIQNIQDTLTENTKASQKRLQSIRDELQAYTEVQADRTTALQDELKAYEEAARVRRESRTDEIEGMHKAIALIDETYAKEQRAAQEALSAQQLAHDKNREIFRSKGETEEAYSQQVYQNSLKIAADEKTIADQKKKDEIDLQKKIIEDRIKAIETAQKADDDAALAWRTNIEKRIEGIHKATIEHTKAINNEIKDIERKQAAETEATNEKLKDLQRDMTKHTQVVNDEIKNIERATAATVKELEAQVKANEDAARKSQEAWTQGLTTIAKVAETTEARMVAAANAAAAAWAAAASAAAAAAAGDAGGTHLDPGRGGGGSSSVTGGGGYPGAGGGGTSKGQGGGHATLLSKEQIRSLVVAAGFQGGDALVATAVALAESGGDPRASNTTGNSPPSTDRGLFQLNSYWQKKYSDAVAYDPQQASAAAYEIYQDRGGNFSAWSAFNNGSYTRYLAAGGSFQADEPYLMMNARTRSIDAVVGEGSHSERISVEPMSHDADQQEALTTTVIIPLYLAGREIGRAVGEIKDRRASHGYGRRR